MDAKEEDDFETDELTACPSCGRDYDDADQDFNICHHCGHNANGGNSGRRSRSIKGYGIDPEVRLDDWEP